MRSTSECDKARTHGNLNTPCAAGMHGATACIQGPRHQHKCDQQVCDMSCSLCKCTARRAATAHPAPRVRQKRPHPNGNHTTPGM
eukprot:9251491-Alexandrium_andersonii.AAC.1